MKLFQIGEPRPTVQDIADVVIHVLCGVGFVFASILVGYLIGVMFTR